MSEALFVQHLTVSFGRQPVLWDLNLAIPPGHLTAIIGPNGAGKSTLIKALLGLIPLKSGQIRFFGKPLDEVRGEIAYIPQRSEIDWNFPITLREFVLMGRYGRLGLFKRPTIADYKAVDEALESVEMLAFSERQIGELSGGQQQRGFIARAYMQEATLYLMDEPFQGIDHATEKLLSTLFKKLQEKGKSLFIVHHDLNTVTSIFDWVVLLNLRLVASGPTKSCYTEENLVKTYGKSAQLFEEVVKRSP